MIRGLLLMLMMVCFVVRSPAGEPKVPLKTEVPEEILAGTPPDVIALLYPGTVIPKEDDFKLMVPKGTVNLALHKKVTASSTSPTIGKLPFVTDGKKAGTDENLLELEPDLQWVQIDLGQPAKIYAVYMWHYFREGRAYEDVIVQVADDAEFKKNVHTIFNNDTDASAKMGIGRDRPYVETNLGRMIDAKGVTARFVRLYSNGNTANGMNHYIEVEVFGKPVKPVK